MSDKIYLKEITLPIIETGEDETYSFVQTDDGLDTPGDAADSKETGDRLNSLKQDLEGLDVYTLGLYPQMQIEDTAVASFADGADDIPVKSLTVDIEPVQSGSGDPSPTNVRPISGWTGANVFRSSKNLFDVHDKLTTVGDVHNYYPRFKPNTYYTCSSNCPQGAPANVYFGGGSTDNNGVYNGQTRTVMSDANGYIPFSVRFNPNGTGINMYQALLNGTYWIQVEEGSTATEYEPVTRYNVNWQTEAGTVYGGTLDVVNGVLTVTHAGVVFNGTEDIYYAGSGDGERYFRLYLDNGAKGRTQATDKKCSVYPYYGGSLTDQPNNTITLASVSPTIQVRSDDYIHNVEGFKGYLAGLYADHTPLVIVYELATPVTYQLTPTEVTTLLLNNNIFTDTGNVNELTYRADLKAYIDSVVS